MARSEPDGGSTRRTPKRSAEAIRPGRPAKRIPGSDDGASVHDVSGWSLYIVAPGDRDRVHSLPGTSGFPFAWHFRAKSDLSGANLQFLFLAAGRFWYPFTSKAESAGETTVKIAAVRIKQRSFRILARIFFILSCGAIGIATWWILLLVGGAIGILQGGGSCLGSSPELGFWIALLPANVLAGIALGSLFAPRLIVGSPG
jgi:hypothetical protein